MATKTPAKISTNVYTLDSLFVFGYVRENTRTLSLSYSFPDPIISIIFEYFLTHWLEWEIKSEIKQWYRIKINKEFP